VTLHADGRVTLGDREVTPDHVAGTLRPHADSLRAEGNPDRESLAWLVLRCDRRAPWGNVLWVLQAASDPHNRIYRIVFAVRPEDGDGEASFALFLPRGRGLVSPWPRADRPGIRVELKTKPGAASRPRDLAGLLALLVPERRGAPAEMNAWREAPAGRVLRLLDILARAGTPWVALFGRPPPRAGSADAPRATWSATDPTGLPSLSLFVEDRPAVQSGAALPAAQGREDLGGFTETPEYVPINLFLPFVADRAGPQIWTDRTPAAEKER
jgi:hypothetical protein